VRNVVIFGEKNALTWHIVVARFALFEPEYWGVMETDAWILSRATRTVQASSRDRGCDRRAIQPAVGNDARPT
jgi:hypothetical protein